MKYFLADPHYGHRAFFRVPQEERIRPFTSSEACDEETLDGINSRVKKSDTLFLLGDIAFGPSLEKFRKGIKYCKDIWVVIGNHDRRNKLKQVFGENKVHDVLERKIGNTPVWMSHYPHLFWPKSHHNSYHLYGHVHDQRSRWILDHFPEARMLDVSPDCHNRMLGGWEPWSEEEVDSVLSVRAGHDHVSFYKEYQNNHLHNQTPIR